MLDEYRQSTTACCPRETIPDSCSCLEDCGCMCADCICANWGEECVEADELDDGLYEDGFCITGCPDDVCRNSGHCVWRASGPEGAGNE